MANRFPLIFNSSANQIQELAASDNLDLTGCNITSAGIITATGGFNLGISSAGTSITSGPLTTLNFVGSGHTFAVAGTTVDISISGGGGGGGGILAELRSTVEGQTEQRKQTLCFLAGQMSMFSWILRRQGIKEHWFFSQCSTGQGPVQRFCLGSPLMLQHWPHK